MMDMGKLLCLIAMLALAFGGRSELSGAGTDADKLTAEADTEARDTVYTAYEIASMLEQSGHAVTCATAPPQMLTGTRYILTLGDAEQTCVTLYEYADSARALADAACIDASGSQVALADKTLYIEWKKAPHFYRLSNVILQYVGDDSALLSLLAELCGEQFAGGAIE